MPKPPLQIPPGHWPRFTRYEIDRGYIRPACDAQFNWYDPWTKFEAERRKSTQVLAPYESLLEAIKKVESRIPTAGERKALATRKHAPRQGNEVLRPQLARFAFDQDQILGWCAQHGLLGLLFHQVVMASIPTRERQRLLLIPNADGWVVLSEETDAETLLYFPDSKAEFEEPYAMVRTLGSQEVRKQEIGETYNRFFPTVEDKDVVKLAVHVPYNEGFWRCYAEPVNDFIQAAVTLRSALDGVARARKDLQKSDFELGALTLDGFLAPVHPKIHMKADGAVSRSWSSPSLLGSWH